MVSHLRCFLIVSLGWIGVGQDIRGDEFTGQRWAVLVGVDDYAQATDLNYCGADMVALHDQLVAVGFPEKQIKLLHDKVAENRFRPFKGNIERQLEIVLGLAERGDLVLVAFSGHGVHFGGTSYFCPAEASLNDSSTLVSLDGVYDRLNRSKAALKLVIVDACRNDPREPGQKSLSNPAEEFAKSLQKPLPEGMILLSSCTAGETSFEEPKFGHGVFMYHLLEGLKGSADSNGDKQISLDELAKYAGRQTKVYVADRFNDSQRPFLKGDLTLDALDFGFATSSKLTSTASPASRPPDSMPSISSGHVEPSGLPQITNTIGMTLNLIPAGEFMMGSPSTDSDASDDEHPQHRASISKSFYLQTTEVTQGQWNSVMGTRPWSGEENVQEGSNYPATYVSWDDALDFCRKLSLKERVEYRLPTEAEWEYACRGGATTVYSFGDSAAALGTYAWFRENTWGANEPYAHEVGKKRANAFGLYDMHGNVWEWCSDWYGADYYKTSPAVDPVGAPQGSYRVNRGGSWLNDLRFVRSAFRFKDAPDDPLDYLGHRGFNHTSGVKYDYLGFRVLRSSVQ